MAKKKKFDNKKNTNKFNYTQSIKNKVNDTAKPKEKKSFKISRDMALTLFLCFIIVFTGILYGFCCPDDKFDTKIYLCYIIAVCWVFVLNFIPKNKIFDTIMSTIIALGSCAYTLYFILNNTALKSINEHIFNILVIFLAMLAVFLLTQSTKWAVISVSGFCWLFYILDEVIICFRKTPIVPSDIFSISSAMTVAQQYSFVLNESMIRSTVAFILLVILVNRYNLKIRPFSFKLCWLPIIPIIITIVGINHVSEAAFKTVDNFDTASSNNRAGILNTFIVNAKNMIVDKPEGYSKKKANEILESYTSGNTTATEDTPNVIVIMNEAFSDLSIVGDFETNMPYMSYIDSMEENTVKGKMLVSVLGGNTCNTEYEFLTGSSLNFLPKGYIPFIRSITSETPSICNLFSDLGYTNTAIHPYMPQCWRREIVYPLLGFDEFISGYDFDENYDVDNVKLRGRVDFGDLDYVRKYISDRESYNKVIETFENKGDGKAFIFNVTMQNHGPYTYTGSDFQSEVTVSGLDLTESEKKEMEQYLTLIKTSDEAFGELIEYFKTVDEDTIIVMFGDHMPGFSSNTFNQLYNNSDKTEELQQLKYSVPFVIWANYDIPEDNPEFMSANYLSSYLMDIMGVDKGAWDNLRDAAAEEYPAINYFGAYDSQGQWIDRDELDSDVLDDYEKVQYGAMFDGIKTYGD